MIISRLKLKNWRNFKDVDLMLTDRVFIIGPNASGKSNLLDAMRFIRDIVKAGGGIQEAVRIRGGLSKIRCLAARQTPDVEILIELSDDFDLPVWRYELKLTQSGGGIAAVIAKVKEEIVTDLRIDKVLLQRPNTDDKKDDARLQQTALEQISANTAFRDIADFVKGIEYLHIVPQLLRDPTGFIKANNTEDFFGRNFLEKINNTNKKTQQAHLRRIGLVLEKILPNFSKLTLEKDSEGHPHLRIAFNNWRGTTAKQYEDQFSDGTLRMIGLLWALQDGTKPILLEEPELSLHSKVVEQLPQAIYRLQSKNNKAKRQVILTTHSTGIISDQGISPDEVILIQPGKESSTAIQFSKLNNVRFAMQNGVPLADLALPRTTPDKVNQLLLSL